jgi:sRNA-binding protein
MDAARAVASDLGMTPTDLRNSLRSWYSSARMWMEDNGHDIRGMDDDAAVRVDLRALISGARHKRLNLLYRRRRNRPMARMPSLTALKEMIAQAMEQADPQGYLQARASGSLPKILSDRAMAAMETFEQIATSFDEIPPSRCQPRISG